jgi:putative membrane protein
MVNVFSTREDDVSNIHRRWSFTRLTPSSIKASYAMTFACAFAVIAISHVFHLRTEPIDLVVHVPLGLVAVFALGLLDKAMLHGAPVSSLSKVVHVSSFANLLWAITVIVGILANSLFAKSSTDYVVAGMMLAAGLRVGIFTSIFGAGLGRAVAVCMVMPIAFFLAFVPPHRWDILFHPVGLTFGALFLALATIWASAADRAGRPHIQSTFRLLQAFISSWTENRSGSIEDIFESRAREETVSTGILKLASPSGEIAAVLPDVHPGPFGQVGGSNLPYALFKRFGGRALVMHGASGHSFNIPSTREVDRYIAGLDRLTIKESGKTASEPIQIRHGSATATAIAFGRTALVMLSLAPKGMEDVPQEVRTELESHAASLDISLLLADCHNAMGGQLDDKDRADTIAAAKECLEQLHDAPQHEFGVGFASLDNVQHKLAGSAELGQSGLAVVVLRIAGATYAIGWADANNMENNLRDKILSVIKDSRMLEVCTSDTHATSGKRTSEGYFALGTASSQDEIAKAFADMSAFALTQLESCTFETALASSKVKVMGEKQFGDYSSALDKSMNITKAFVGATFAVFVAMQVLAS